MSLETQTESTSNTENEAPTTSALEVKPVTTGETNVVEFKEGDWKGYKFTSISFEKVSDITDAYGEKAVVDLVNTIISSRIRAKVKNGLPKDKTPQELQVEKDKLRKLYPDGVLFTEKNAREWRPDADRMGPNKLMKMVKDAMAKGDVEGAKAALAKMSEIMLKGAAS